MFFRMIEMGWGRILDFFLRSKRNIIAGIILQISISNQFLKEFNVLIF